MLSRADGAVHTFTLHRPARRNALTPALARRLATEVDAVAERNDCRVIVLRGAGGHFSSGLDLRWLQSLGAMPAVADLQRGLSDFQSAVLAVVRCPIPVVAVVEGTAAGFGLDLALACDMRIATTDARVTSAFARMGLVPDGGSTFTLPRLTGLGQALRLLMAGDTLDAERACAIGLVDDVVDPAALEARLGELLAALAAAAPTSLRAIKRLVRGSELGALEQAMAAEGAVQLQALQSEEFRRRLEVFTSRAARAET
ncbi:MAG TPA: enoyl-CoA hydratase/isomerase family protein [Gemmatimonadales bacterium]|nr:enoyl-CoA hydratase/isomerase family protein [Gemmatimonadales bacterium]